MHNAIREATEMNSIDSAQKRVAEAARRLVADGTEIGLQVVVYQNGHRIVDVAEGYVDRGSTVPATPDTLFPVFSVTKAIVVTCLHIQVDRGLIAYDDPVTKYWPEYGANGKEATLVRDIVMHRAG